MKNILDFFKECVKLRLENDSTGFLLVIHGTLGLKKARGVIFYLYSPRWLLSFSTRWHLFIKYENPKSYFHHMLIYFQRLKRTPLDFFGLLHQRCSSCNDMAIMTEQSCLNNSHCPHLPSSWPADKPTNSKPHVIPNLKWEYQFNLGHIQSTTK